MRSKGRRLEVRDCASWILKGSQNCHMSWWNFVSCKYAAWNLAQSDRKKCLLDHPLLRKCLTANLILLTRDTMRQTEKGGKVPLFYEIATLMFTIFTWTNNAPCLCPQIWHNLCFQFSPGYCSRPNGFAKFWGVNYDKVHYGLCENVEFNCFLVRCDERNY